jgi:hypothetical protein
VATTKLILRIGLALLVAGGAGWVLGASGRSNSDRALQVAELRAELLEGRAALLDARLDIYSINFGDASRHLDAARRCPRPHCETLTRTNRLTATLVPADVHPLLVERAVIYPCVGSNTRGGDSA